MDHLSDEEISNLVPPQFVTLYPVEACKSRAVLEIDGQGYITHLDATLEKILAVEFSTNEFIGLSLEEFESAIVEGNDASARLIELIAQQRYHDTHETAAVSVSGGITLNVEFVPLLVSEELTRRMWLIRDDTVRANEIDRIRFQAAVLSQVSDAVLTVDANMAISYWNKGAEELTGRKASEVIGLGPEEVFQFRFPSPGDEHTAWKELGEGGAWSGELIINTTNSERDRYVATNAKILRDEAGEFTGLLAVVRDETERREMEDKLIHHAYHDLLTGLPNRMMLLRTLDSLTSNAQKEAPSYALLFLDLDRFKMVNDSLGHHAGDAMLKTLAVRLKECVRGHDIVARL